MDHRFDVPRSFTAGSALARLQLLLQETLSQCSVTLGLGLSDRTAPAVTVDGSVSANCVARSALTEMLLVATSDEDAVSMAVTVCVPLRRNEVMNVPTPLAKTESPGKRALGSLLVKCTVPEYPLATLPTLSLAVTVRKKLPPAVAVKGANLWDWDALLADAGGDWVVAFTNSSSVYSIKFGNYDGNQDVLSATISVKLPLAFDGI